MTRGRVRLPDRARALIRRAGLTDATRQAATGLAAVALVAMILVAVRFWPRPVAFEQPDSAIEISPAADSSAEASEAVVLVHVVGAVRSPGVYELPVGARVTDAVTAAGGPSDKAILDAINLARVVQDGEQILVPDDAAAATAIAPGGAGAAAGAGSGTSLVNINTADEALLDTLPGIGPATAQRILADRTANGPYASVDDLGRVSGIGPKRLEQLKPLVCSQ